MDTGYRVNTKDIWKLVNKIGSTNDFSEAIYCLKAGVGLGGRTGIATGSTAVYDVSYDMKKIGSIPSNYRSVLPSADADYNAILWIADNMYLPKHTPDAERKKMRDDLLSAAFSTPEGIKEGVTLNNCTITDDDIEATQQLAIWHFTNPGSDWDLGDSVDTGVGINFYVSSTGDNFGQLDKFPNGQERQIESGILYNYLVSNAKANASSYGTGSTREIATTPISFENTTKKIEMVGSNYIVGPFKIKGMSGIEYGLELEVTNQAGTAITNYSVLDENKAVISNPTTSDLVGKDIYISIPTTVVFDSVNLKVKSSYFKTEVVFWTSSTDYLTEQPVIIVEKIPAGDEITTNVEKKTGEYNIKLIKVDNANNTKVLENAIFEITLPDGTKKNYTTDANGCINISNLEIKKIERQTILIKEIKAPSGYKIIVGDITLGILTKENTNDYGIDSTQMTVTGINSNAVKYNSTTNTIEITIANEKKEFDLALRKFITKINGIAPTASREPVVDVTPLANKTATTAIYTHPKNPLEVEKGANVIYTIRVYNESEVDGYVDKIEDYLPEELEFATGSSINTQYGWSVSTDGRTVTTEHLKGQLIKAFDGNSLDYKDVQIECKVKDTAVRGKVMTNIAQISADSNETPDIPDRDSTPDNVVKPSDSDLPNYAKNQEDDDDYEKIIIKEKEFDLALRKFITKINGIAPTVSREPVVDVTPLVDGSDTTAIYTHPKNPLVVEKKDTITYTIRIYNEGDIDGYADKIEDYLPEELEFVAGSAINTQYGWSVSTDGRNVTTEYLKGQVIKAFNGNNLDYKDVEIECKVKDTAVTGKILTNIAQIMVDSNETPDIPDRDSTPDNVIKPNDNELPKYADNQEDDDDYEKVIIETKPFDLALRKYITKVNGVATTVSREPVVDTTALANGTATTATYKHPKNPLKVSKGDTITYTIRVYNEGEINGYVDKIEDYLPEELEFVTGSTVNTQYGWSVSTDGRTVTTQYLKGTELKAFDGTTLDYKEVEIECKVKDSAKSGRVMTNIAQIVEDSNETPDIPDRDSTPNNDTKPTDDKLPDYKGNNTNKSDLSDKNYHYKGQEDDDDFEKVVIEAPFDLSLRKFITKVNNTEVINRIPQVTVTPLVNGTKTTAIYNHTKDPVVVKNGDIVIYTIRIYNEGETDGYAQLIKDNIPEGLEFLVNHEINVEYRWKLVDAKTVESDYLSKQRDENNLLKAFDPDTMQTLDYKDVKIAFKVIEPNTSDRILINIAEIKEDADKDGNPIEDRDSTPDNDKDGEDDLDKEYLKLQYFDLALRKFITGVNDTKVTDRIPQITIDEEGNIKYVHTKEAILVANSDIVTYTIRVYNEGKTDGYANEIKDNIPEGLEFLPENEINKQYKWKMYDENGEITTDATKAKTIRSDYLSEENGEDNIIKAFDRNTMKEPEYKDVQVVFKVTEKNLPTDRVIINIAEISKDSDDDIDSTPDNDKEKEDDIDKEYLKVKYFDLSLLKWVSKAIVTVDGKTTITETGYNGLENPEPIVKVDLDKKKLNKTTVKFAYIIKITNEGEIAGYATEIKDYIPEGLEFYKEDNPDWEKDGENTVVTNKLAKTLLQPGESAEVEIIFRWKNNENNLGQKRNVAEISEDYNDKGAEDIDSTPDNKKEGEDDIDDALVILTIKTGAEGTIYFSLTVMVLSILCGGIYLIKRYVLE